MIHDERKLYLDGLRGVAALIVLMSHALITFCEPLITIVGNSPDLIALGKSPMGLLWNGNAAVCIFFILSGFVMAQMTQHAGFGFPALALRRYVRLALPILLTSSFAYLLLRFGLLQNREAGLIVGSGWLHHWYDVGPSGRNMLYESLIGTFLTGSNTYNANLWTMQAELTGSLIVIGVFSISRTSVERSVLLALYFATHLADYLALFAIGALLYDLTPIIGRLRPICLIILAVGSFLCSMPAAAVDNPLPWFDFLPRISQAENARYWHSIGATLIVISVLSSTSLQWLLRSEPAQFLGRVSFVLYLIHLPLICGPISWLILALQSSPLTMKLIGLPLTVILSLSLAALTYRIVDGWPIKFSRYIGYISQRALSIRSPTLIPEAVTT